MAKDYTKYDAWDFIEEPSFIEYVRYKQSNQFDWATWIAEHPNKKAEVEEAAELIDTILVPEEDMTVDHRESLLAKINHSIDSEVSEIQPPQAKVKNLWLRYVAAAAVILLITTFIFWPKDSMEQIETQLAETKELLLPDQSKIQINAQTVLSYNAENWSKERKIILDGEAFFDVEKGAKFTVETQLGIVEVLGTSFNVLNRGAYFEVKCASGRVSVKVSGHDEIILTQDEAAYFNKQANSFNEKPFANAIQNIWTAKEAYFDDKPLQFVFEELERQFNLDIITKTNKTFNGPVQLNDLDSALYQICWPMNLKYTIDGKTVTIE